MATKGPKNELPTAITADAKSPRKPGARAKKPAVAAAVPLADPVPAPAETIIPPAVVPPIAPTTVAPVKPEPVIAAEPAPVAVAAEPAPVAPAPQLSMPPAAAPSAFTAPEKTARKKETTMENTLHANAEKTQAFFADMNSRTKEAMEKSTKMFADMNEFAKGNVDAVVESSKVAMKGFESLSQEAADYTRRSFETATATMRNLAAVKTPAELMKLQSDYVRQSFDSLVAETSKHTEAMIKLANDVAQPISNRVAVAAEKIKVGA